jgi:nicotinamidase/pyrazinamidase
MAEDQENATHVLVVVDMQNDFIDGALGTKEAVAILPAALKKMADFEGTVFFTRDTHPENYLMTQEGRNLPVRHCIRGTHGWQLAPAVAGAARVRQAHIFDKPTFGSTALAETLARMNWQTSLADVTLIGLCTDICVVSNALMIKAFLPEVPVIVDAACCAGVTPEKHQAALETMRSCQIQVINDK